MVDYITFSDALWCSFIHIDGMKLWTSCKINCQYALHEL